MMRILLCTIAGIQLSMVNAQTEIWDYQGFSIGENCVAPAFCDQAYMPEIVNIGGTYFMYYTTKTPTNFDAISYATSPDLLNWTVEDTIMVGSADTLNREYIFGGPRVIELSSGQYRMFYRCCQKYTSGSEPQYHIRSAISSDGIIFVKEGIRIEIEAYDASSFFSHVGHSAFYFDEGGNVAALLTAKDTTLSSFGPDRLYTAFSTDEGMTFSGFTDKYADCHDPVVVVDSTGEYHAYFTYLNTGSRTAKSPDGVIWPAVPDTLLLMQGTDTLIEADFPGIADLGAVVNPSGEIYLYSNYHTAMGAWTDVAWYKMATANLVKSTESRNEIRLYPNPSNGTFRIIGLPLTQPESSTIEIQNSLGEIIFTTATSEAEKEIVLAESIATGVYFLRVMSDGAIVDSFRLVIQ